ncbi:YnbE family lipoprotein [Desulfospira joergensenii]|uniref:YnbE family lipoprotein n=1 Tax=Desulfospira joergensenii TaxID=53329 RepID=UPI0003B7434E|nr:YnbE family lipoprotein [Desulfospira joergensenii]
MANNIFRTALVFILFGFVSMGCQTSHEVEMKPVEIKPIHITIDVNVRVEKALDDFFDDLEAAEDEIKE